MSFKKKSTYIKQECEYESPDGEKYDISIIKHEDRVYIQWGLKSDAPDAKIDTVTIDGQMLESLFKIYQEILDIRPEPRKGMKMPFIVDHRNKSSIIENEVDKSMKNFRDDIRPVASFDQSLDSKEGRMEIQTGISMEDQSPVGETPDDIREYAGGIQDDIKGRIERPLIAPESKVKRINAGDLI